MIKRYEVLKKLIEKHQVQSMVEVGTAAGITAKYLLDNVKDPLFHLRCVDPYFPYPEYMEDPNSFPERIKKNFHTAQRTVFDSYDNVEHFQMFSQEACRHFVYESMDLIFIDANHSYEAVKNDMEYWYPMVKTGGIFCGHDYHSKFGVPKAVDEFVEKNNIKTMEVLPGYIWMWQKEEV